MNKAELERNAVLTEYDIVDLNEQPKLPYADNTFDFITNVVSVDYLTKPMEVFRCARLKLAAVGDHAHTPLYMDASGIPHGGSWAARYPLV